MKHIIFSVAAATLLMTACNTAPHFTIKGTVEGEQTGNVNLLHMQDGKIDTLARAGINNGKFELSGNVEGLKAAILNIEGKRVNTMVLLENTAYTANLSTTNRNANKVESEAASQKLYNSYIAKRMEIEKKMSNIKKEFGTAFQNKDEEKMGSLRENFFKLQEEMTRFENDLLKANPDSFVAAFILKNNMHQLDVKELKAKFAELGENAKASEPGKDIVKRIQKMEAVAIGQIAPDFTLNTPEGKALSMHSIKAKVKIIDFWASWCGPCRGENPNVVKIYADYHKKGLEILGVSLDSKKEAWVDAIASDKLVWNHVSDLKGWQSAAAQQYGVNGIPHMLVLDENNRIVAKNLRGNALRAKIAELLD